MTGILRIEMRRSLLVRLSPLAAAALVALMVNDIHTWRGIWPEGSAHISAPLLFIGPLMGGVGAWEVRRRCLAGAARGARSRAAPWITPLLIAHLLSGAAVIATGALCAIIANLASGAPAGFLWPSYVLVALACLTECIAVGLLLGRLGGPAWFAPVITVMLLFLRLVITLPGSGDAMRFHFTRLFLSGRASAVLSPIGVALAVLEAGLVVVLAWSVPDLIAHTRAIRARTAYPWSRTHRRTVAVGSLGCVVAGALVLTSPRLTQERRPPKEPVCTSTEFRICVWPDEAARLPGLTRIAERVPEQAQALGVPVPDRISSNGLEDTRSLEPGSSNFVIESDSTWFAADSAAGLLTASVASAQCYPHDESGRQAYFKAARELSMLLELRLQAADWPQGMRDNSGVDRAEIARIGRADEEEQQTWIDERLATMHSLAAGSDPEHCP